ncbi:hypothetical protein [Erwinia amylovora]|uniref:Uncharacterized protein n=4 Tax=Erwinia amylovora TaxID=552 RepID=A0A831ESB1_ERWAM|nr:hypothetical protein [Erwinia amylovora]CBX81968.1 hypothetical protein predicted by Glimmer/Critica [Erwinia amylovora ATCC BAA-2158]CDK16422.1 hypothetical protein LA635_2798 [Erwinia amylovora LA635]CDK19789.1 hypothetical protein LA636_2797 [Erwinia amylovora LA636]CDK23160.1 hypothetical protein LA637_2800 [Erwinia amylovora LA637]ATZ10461.1 hypothetical protein AD997_02760 [Erwinia amylovora]
MKISIRTTWIAVFIFCVLLLALIFVSLIRVANDIKKALQQPVQDDPNKLAEQLKKLKLNEKQKKFIESLIKNDEKKQ